MANINPTLKSALKETQADEYLFSDKLDEALKAAKNTGNGFQRFYAQKNKEYPNKMAKKLKTPAPSIQNRVCNDVGRAEAIPTGDLESKEAYDLPETSPEEGSITSNNRAVGGDTRKLSKSGSWKTP